MEDMMDEMECPQASVRSRRFGAGRKNAERVSIAKELLNKSICFSSFLSELFPLALLCAALFALLLLFLSCSVLSMEKQIEKTINEGGVYYYKEGKEEKNEKLSDRSTCMRCLTEHTFF